MNTELDILKSQELGMFRIEVTGCLQCPFVHKSIKRTFACDHKSRQVTHPYRTKRRLSDPSVIWEECPILYCNN